MTIKNKIDEVEIELRSTDGYIKKIYFDVLDSPLSIRWLAALNDLLKNSYHLEKNFCFLGFSRGERNGSFILDQINKSIKAINESDIGYQIDDFFTMENCVNTGPIGYNLPGRQIIHDKFNCLHRYFEDLQGSSTALSSYYIKADPVTRWNIRQLNLLCHEFESWALSYRKELQEPEWQRPSQLMCWLNAPRFVLNDDDYQSFGIDSLNRPLGGVFVGVNKAVGKHHWEVFTDEAKYDPTHRTDTLTTTELKGQTEAAGDFDIEWANNPGNYPWQSKRLADFRTWLLNNGFDPDDEKLTIGHPQIGQIDLHRSFESDDYRNIWHYLNIFSDVFSVRTTSNHAIYDYRWNDPDFVDRQVKIITKGK